MEVPNHIAIILDGNGRWARAKGMPRSYGHVVGCDNLEKMCNIICDMGVKYLTVYAFSTENWKRSQQEIKVLMNLFRRYLKRCERSARRNADARAGRIPEEKVSPELFESYLDTAGIPDPDLLIRTSGEERISNFLLWQLAYTEFYFTDVPWPAFDKEELVKAIEKYNGRDRRYGGVRGQKA